jgi:hypothetical protein
MKSFSAFITAMLIILASTCLASPCAALESKFFTVAEKTLSMDMGPSFAIEQGNFNASKDGIVIQEFLINNTETGSSALVSVSGVYDKQMSNLSSANISEIFAAGLIMAMEGNGYNITGNWTALDSNGRDVIAYTLARENPDNTTQKKTIDLAVWNLEASSYASIISLLDRENTTKMINTMALT